MSDETRVQPPSPTALGDTYAEVTHHKREADRLSAVAKERGRRNRAIVAELETLRKQHADLTKAHAEISTRYREITHKSEFARLAKEAGVDPEFADDLWHLAGYKPEADDPDPKVITQAIASLKERKPRYFQPAKPADPKPDETPAPAPDAKDGEPAPTPEPAPAPVAGPPSAKGATSGVPGSGSDPASRRAQILAARGTPDILRFPPAEVAEAYKSVGT